MAEKKFKSTEVVLSAWRDLNSLRQNRSQLLWQFAVLTVIVFFLSVGIAMLPFASAINPVMLQLILFLTTGLGIYIMAPTIVALHRFAATNGNDDRPVPKLTEFAPRKYWAWAFVLAMAPSLVALVLGLFSGSNVAQVNQTPEFSVSDMSFRAINFAFSIAYLYIAVRVFPLLPSAALDPTSVSFGTAFNLTKGHFWKIVGAIFLLTVPITICLMLASLILVPITVAGGFVAVIMFAGIILIQLFGLVLLSLIAIFTSTHVFMKLLELTPSAE